MRMNIDAKALLTQKNYILKTKRIMAVEIDEIKEHISGWRKELPIKAENGMGSDNGNLNRKKRKIFRKYRMTNTRKVAQLTETFEQKVHAKAQRIRRYEKRETLHSQNKMFFISFHLFSLQRSVQDYKIHIDVEIVIFA